MMAAENRAGTEASMTFSAKYVKRALEVTDSTETVATLRALPKIFPADSISAGETGGMAERALSDTVAFFFMGVSNAFGETKADEPSIAAKANVTAKTADLSNFMVGCRKSQVYDLESGFYKLVDYAPILD
mmetsp:Transcript_9644/g.23632  ORF Transcript_9644/g.23632 Transcript_9644/m.23632 type:complete len:131 (-) Transcript_9644:42-434(-)